MVRHIPHWLQWEPPVPPEELAEGMETAAAPSVDYYLMVLVSATLATLGLVADSVAVIIGAMIIAPLMDPIVGLSYALVRSNRRLFLSATFSILSGIALVIAVSWGVTRLLDYQLLGTQIVSRGTPSLIDLGIAIGSGIAGAVARSRRRIASALPGVAIAVALVPPVCVTGIGLALGDTALLDGVPDPVQNEYKIEAGSFLLFLTNFTAVIFCGSVVFLVQGYGRWRGARGGLIASLVLLAMMAIPLSFTFSKMRFRSGVASTLVELSADFPEWDSVEVRRIQIQSLPEVRLVQLHVDATPGDLTPEHVAAIESAMQERFKREITVQAIISDYEILTSQGVIE